MFQIPRFPAALLMAAALAAPTSLVMTSTAKAQFFFDFFRDPSARQAPARQGPQRQQERVRRAPAPAPSHIPDFDAASAGAKASFNDTARYLAGLAPAEDSPLARYTRDGYWQQHARSFDHSWQELENRRLSKIRAWSAQNLKDRKAPLYYMFSGPDLLYADAFFPNATTYLLAGLEPVGQIPQINARTYSALGSLRQSMASSISLSFFITKNMKSQLRETALTGTLPILMVYAARAGKTITDIGLVTLDPDGTVHPVTAGAAQRGVQGVKMTFGGPGKPTQILYYFSTDISDSGLKPSGFLKFAETFGPGDAMFKAASYLPHSGGFSQIRDFVLAKAQNVVQDDSGIPVHYFKRDQWILHPFGRYLGPIALFPGRRQAQLDEIYRKGPVKPLDFGMGYRWRPNESNMLWAQRKEAPKEAPKDAPKDVPVPSVLRPSISEPERQAVPVAPLPAQQQEVKPVEASPAPQPQPAEQQAKPDEPELLAPFAQPQQEAKPVEAAPAPVAEPQQEAKPAAEPASPPAAPDQAASSADRVQRP